MREALARMIAGERADLLAFLAGVPGDAWSRPTVCEGWDVRDVLAHMVEGELNVGRVYRGELRESGFIDPHEGVARWRALPGEAVRGALWQHGIATQRVLDAMTEQTYRSPIRVFGCREVRQLVRLQLFDLVVHGHDITDALGAPPVWGPRLAFVVEFCVRAAPPTFARHGFAPEGALEVRVEGRRWVLDGRTGSWTVGNGDAPASVSLAPEDFVLLATGRRPQDEVLARAAVEGDRATAERILGAWRVV